VPSAELFEPGEYLQDQGRPGYFTLAAKPDGKWQQASYQVTDLATIVEGVNPFHDSYISQAIFEFPNRLCTSVRDVGLLFADLDTYNQPGLQGKTAEQLTALLLIFCADAGIPEPSIILYSGRGLQAKWLLSSAVERIGLMEWNAAEHALVKLLSPFAGDTNAMDVSRVLRLVRTVNTRSGERVRVTHVTGGLEACPARYDFRELLETLVGQAVDTLPKEERRKATGQSIVAMPGLEQRRLHTLNWTRLDDLRTLCRIRGGVRKGSREVTLFWQLNFLLLAEPVRASNLWREAESLASQIDSGWFSKEIRQNTFSTLYRKARQALAGELVTFNGRTLPPGYTPRNQTLIDIFSITPEEERELRTIISAEEKYRRKVEKRRAAGVKERVDRSDKPWEAEGISRRAWYYRRAHESRLSGPPLDFPLRPERGPGSLSPGISRSPPQDKGLSVQRGGKS